MKAKKELVLTTYKDYVKHFGVVKGAKRWKEKKDLMAKVILTKMKIPEDRIVAQEELKIEKGKKERIYESKPVEVNTEDLEPIQKAILGGAERQDVRKTKGDILECGNAMIELIKMPAWNRWLKPQIQKDMVDFVMKATMTSGEVRDEAMGGYKYAKKILNTIDKRIADYTYVIKEEEKKQNASRI